MSVSRSPKQLVTTSTRTLLRALVPKANVHISPLHMPLSVPAALQSAPQTTIPTTAVSKPTLKRGRSLLHREDDHKTETVETADTDNSNTGKRLKETTNTALPRPQTQQPFGMFEIIQDNQLTIAINTDVADTFAKIGVTRKLT